MTKTTGVVCKNLRVLEAEWINFDLNSEYEGNDSA